MFWPPLYNRSCEHKIHIAIFVKVERNFSSLFYLMVIYPLPPAQGFEHGDQLFRAHSYVSSWMTLLLLTGTESSWMMYLYIKVDRVSLSLGIIFKPQEEKNRTHYQYSIILCAVHLHKKCKLVPINEFCFV